MTSRDMVVLLDGHTPEPGNQLLYVIELGLPKSSSLDLSEWHLSAIDDNNRF